MDDLDVQNENECLVTAQHIFDYYGVRNTGSISVDSLMDKFSASEKSNKSEYKHLKNILDPMENNPDIDVTQLADALHKYSETQKEKVDLEDSFNLKSGSVPQDSDSGISNDGFQLLEELQCELREKSQLTSQLRDEMYFMEQQNEELLSGLTSERDALKAQILLLREEKQKFITISHEYEDACTRLASMESAFEHARRDLEISRKNCKSLGDSVEQLQIDKQSLEELLSKSKEECHRINEMYAVRQASLLEENETLKSEHADMKNRYDDQQHLLQKILQEKTILEMELKDILNKSVDSPKLDNTIDVSYIDDQVLSTLDSITVDSKFGSQQLLDEDSFTMALNNSQGRTTNMTLFDEIRLSFCNSPFAKEIDKTNTMSTQTEYNRNCECNTCALCFVSDKMCDNPSLDTDKDSKQKLNNDTNPACTNCDKLNLLIKKLEKQYDFEKNLSIISIDFSAVDSKVSDEALESNQLNISDHEFKNEDDKCAECVSNTNNIEIKDLVQEFDCKKCLEFQSYIEELEMNLKENNNETNTTCSNCDKLNLLIKELEKQYDFEKNLSMISIDFSAVNHKVSDGALKSNQINVSDHEFKNEDDKCAKCVRNTNNIDIKDLVQEFDCRKCLELQSYIEEIEMNIKDIDDNVEKVCRTCETQTLEVICRECITFKETIDKLELNLDNKSKTLKETEINLTKHEENVNNLVRCLEERTDINANLKITIDYLKCKLLDIESAFNEQKLLINNLNCDNRAIETQNDCVQVNVSSQTDEPYEDCTKKTTAEVEPRKFSAFLWNSFKSLFQLFAIICFCMAIYYMYNVTQQHSARECRRGRIPWKWFSIQDLLDFALRMEYVGEIPM